MGFPTKMRAVAIPSLMLVAAMTKMGLQWIQQLLLVTVVAALHSISSRTSGIICAAAAWVPSSSTTTTTTHHHSTRQENSSRRISLPFESTIPTRLYSSTSSTSKSDATSSSNSNSNSNNNMRIPPGYEVPFYPVPRKIDESLLGDLTGGRPGAIIETEEQLASKEQIMKEMEQTGGRNYSPEVLQEYYGEAMIDEDDVYDIDDPDALDAATLGTWTIQDIRARFAYEWDPHSGEADPNLLQLQQDDMRYVTETEKDSDGVEIGYDPVFGPSNPIDTRTIVGAIDSYMIDTKTRNDEMLQPQFPNPNDIEIEYNEDVVQFRKSLDILETYVDPFLPNTMILPKHVATWYGYPEQMYFTPQNFTHNRFTPLDQMTNFDEMSPYDARKKAVEMARSKNAEWLPSSVSYQWHQEQREPYERYNTLVGTLRPGDCNPELVAMIQPALNILGSCCQLLSIDTNMNENTNNENDKQQDQNEQPIAIYRFAYHGLMKNKFGMQCWTQTLLEDCGVTVTGVVFETGFRRRDTPYDGGNPWYAPTF